MNVARMDGIRLLKIRLVNACTRVLREFNPGWSEMERKSCWSAQLMGTRSLGHGHCAEQIFKCSQRSHAVLIWRLAIWKVPGV